MKKGILLAALLSGFLSTPVFADSSFLKPQYSGISFGLGREAGAVVKNSDEYEYTSQQMKLVFGKPVSANWRLEAELTLGRVKEWDTTCEQAGFLLAVGIAGIYDFYRYGPSTFFAGAGVSLGHLNPRDGWEELASNLPYFLLDGRLGWDYRLDSDWHLRIYGAISHICSIGRDQGHNNLMVFFGFTRNFKSLLGL